MTKTSAKFLILTLVFLFIGAFSLSGPMAPAAHAEGDVVVVDSAGADAAAADAATADASAADMAHTLSSERPSSLTFDTGADSTARVPYVVLFAHSSPTARQLSHDKLLAKADARAKAHGGMKSIFIAFHDLAELSRPEPQGKQFLKLVGRLANANHGIARITVSYKDGTSYTQHFAAAQPSHGLSTGVIIAILLGGIALVCLFIGLASLGF